MPTRSRACAKGDEVLTGRVPGHARNPLVSAAIDLDAVRAAYRELIAGRAPALKTIIRP